MTTFCVLGPLAVLDAQGTEIGLAGPLQRRLLAALLLNRGRVTPAPQLTDLVWADEIGAPSTAALQSLVYRLRQRVPDLRIEHRPPGYVVHVDDAELDAARFERSVLEAIARKVDDPTAAVALLDDALGQWRGAPYEDLVDADDGRIEIARLGELRLRAAEERCELLVELGRPFDAVPELEGLVIREPLRERSRRTLIDAYAATGRRADALRVFDAYRRLLAEELGVSPSAELRLRHERLLAEDDAVAAPPPPPSEGRPPVRPPLRRPTSSLVGRDRLLGELVRSIASRRLVTLVGPGGVGKTRLALEAAHRAMASFADGVVFCDLTPAGPVPVLGVVLGAVRVERRDGQDDFERLAEVLRHDRCLVVLDNCEHVVDEVAALVERLLETTEQVAIVATSRERLAVDGEQLLPVPTLPCEPDAPAEGAEPGGGGRAGDLDGPAPAAELFVERAQAVMPGYAPGPAERALVERLCRRLDGLPLAIELAAARLQSLSLQEVLDGLDHSLSVLRGGRRTVDRHRSVEAALRWSVDTLDPDEAAALAAAAQFATAFEAGDVAAVLGASEAEAVDSLARLVERSLAHRDGSRFFLLDIVRRFTVEQAPPDALGPLRARHVERMQARALELGAALCTDASATTVESFIRLIPDFRQAAAAAIALGEPGRALAIVFALRSPALNAMHHEPMHWGLDAALAADTGNPDDDPRVVDGYAVAALGAWKRGDLAETRRRLERAEIAAARLGRRDWYQLLATQGVEDLAYGRLESAVTRLRAALRCDAIRDDPLAHAESGAALAICMAYVHDPGAIAAADGLVEDLVPGAGATIAAWCWYAAGEVRLDREPGQARAFLERAVACARAGGNAFVEGVAGASLASIDVRAGDVASAVRQYRSLFPVWLRTGVRSPFWTAMRAVTALLASAGEHAVAARLLGAVTSPTSGHAVAGDDDGRLSAIREDLCASLGAAALEEALRTGAMLDDASAAALATDAFDRIG